MYESPSNLNDEWGKSIIDEFLREGGFRNPEAMRAAHDKFLTLISTDYDPEDAWELRGNALAVWALICIELELPSDEQELLRVSIAVALERFPGGHPHWFGQLAFDLVFEAPAPPAEGGYRDIARLLFQTIKQAVRTPSVEGSDFLLDGLTGLDIFDGLLGPENDQRIESLTNTKKLLKRLGNAGVNEADYLLALGFGESKDRKYRLRQAVKGAWPASQLAALYLGNLLSLESREREAEGSLRAVRFPSEDDPEYEFLCGVARKAKAILIENTSGKFGSDAYRERFGEWSINAKDVADQWESVERCTVRLQNLEFMNSSKDAPPVDLPEHVHSLTLETGRLVEAFLKWCLSTWFADQSKLNLAPGPLKAQELTHFNAFVGCILGKGPDGASISLEGLLNRAGLSLWKHQVHKLIGGWKRAEAVWTCSTANLASLVAANAIAAKTREGHHPFCHIELDLLIDAMSVFSTAYFVRNDNAHFVRESSDRTSASEAIFWAKETRKKVDQLMIASMPLMPRPSRTSNDGRS